MGFFDNGFGESLGQGALMTGASEASGFLGSLGSLIGQRRQYKYNKKLMAKQNQYAIDAFNRENARQDYLLANAASLNKQSLANAGYSTADPNGMGVQAANTNTLNPPGTPSSTAPMLAGNADLAGNMSSLAQTKLVKNQADLLEEQAKKMRSEREWQDIVNDLKRRFGEEEVTANIAKLDSETGRNLAQMMNEDQDRLNSIQLTEATVKNIEERLEMDWMKVPSELQVLAAQVNELRAKARLDKAQAAECYQSIRESAQRIEKLKSEKKLTDAEIQTAVATKRLIEQELKTEKAKTRSAEQKARIDKIEADAKSVLGDKYFAAMQVADDISNLYEKIGNTTGNIISSFTPFTDKSDSSTVTYHKDGSKTETYSNSSRTRSRK